MTVRWNKHLFEMRSTIDDFYSSEGPMLKLKPGERTGMATPVVLAAILIIIVITTAMTQLARSSYGSERSWTRRVETSWLLQAGLNRSVLALITPGDPLRERLFKDETTLWTYEGQTMVLRLESESEKVDINTADRRSVMDRVVQSLPGAPPETLEDIETALARARDRHVGFSSPDEMLPLEARFGPMEERLRRNLTVFSGQRIPSPPLRPQGTGLDIEDQDGPAFARAATIDAAPLSRPIYRIIATSAQGEAAPSAVSRSASVTLMLSANDQTVFRIVDGHL